MFNSAKANIHALFIEYFTIFTGFILKSFVETAERLFDFTVRCYTISDALLFLIFILQLLIYHSDLPACVFIQTRMFIIHEYFVSNEIYCLGNNLDL